MSSNDVSVQAIIKKDSQKELYVHCSSYYLNLVIDKSCKVTAIRYMLEKLIEVCLFFRDAQDKEIY